MEIRTTEKIILIPTATVIIIYKCFKFCFVSGILDKNRDTFSADLVGLVCESNKEFLFDLFAKEMSMVRSDIFFTYRFFFALNPIIRDFFTKLNERLRLSFLTTQQVFALVAVLVL